jgi:protein-disulfide isomerase
MKRLALIALGVLALVAVACGGNDDSNGNEAPGGTGTAATAAASPTPADPIERFAQLQIPDDLADGDALGKEDAPLTLQLFEDFQCPFCLAFNLNYEAMLIEEYVKPGKLRLEFRHFTILGEESVQAALAGLCTAQQNRFWHMHDLLFLEQARAGQLQQERLNAGRFSADNLRRLAGEAGANLEQFDACIADSATVQRLQADVREARQLGLRGTPALVLDGTPVQTPGSLAAFRKLLDDALAAK